MGQTKIEWTIREFCEFHGACKSSALVAMQEYHDVRDAWARLPADDLIWVATRLHVLDDRTLRLFACWCVRQVWHLLDDPRSRKAVETAEQYARGEATHDELAAAWAAAKAAAWAAARAAAWAAAWAASSAASRAASSAAAWDAAWAAAWDAASDAASAAAWAASREKQAKWLRTNAKPNFFREVSDGPKQD